MSFEGQYLRLKRGASISSRMGSTDVVVQGVSEWAQERQHLIEHHYH
jgi:hypothetical protein